MCILKRKKINIRGHEHIVHASLTRQTCLLSQRKRHTKLSDGREQFTKLEDRSYAQCSPRSIIVDIQHNEGVQTHNIYINGNWAYEMIERDTAYRSD